jgi:hypothetical protein
MENIMELKNCKICEGRPMFDIYKYDDGWKKECFALCKNCEIKVSQNADTQPSHQNFRTDENMKGLVIKKWNMLNS